MNNEDFLKLVGKFCDFDGNPVEASPDAQVVIVAGPWEHMPVGAMQTKCQVCARLLGVAPPSQAMLAQPGRVHLVLCRHCWKAFGHWRQGDTEAMLRAIEEGME
jgi:hypothetical protein